MLATASTRTSYISVLQGDEDYSEVEVLHELHVSMLGSESSQFAPLLDLSYRTREDAANAFDTTHCGLSANKDTADQLELFACGAIQPETAHSGTLLLSLIIAARSIPSYPTILHWSTAWCSVRSRARCSTILSWTSIS